MNRYFASSEKDDTLEIYVFGDITKWPWVESDVSSYSMVKVLKESKAKNIDVKINSYGGEVAEALAIYNELKDKQRNGVAVTTMNMGFACSAASVIFCAGQNRLMAKNSLLMIHNPWIYTSGNADDLRKEADTLDKITQSVKSVYLDVSTLSDDELKSMLDAETWIDSQDAIGYGFATTEIKENDEQSKAAARVKHSVFDMVTKHIPPKAATSNFEKMFNKFKGE